MQLHYGGGKGTHHLSPVPSFMIVFPMARMVRTVVAGLPHHVTQRGNRRKPIFFEDGDQEIYRDLLAEQTRKAGVEVWAYWLVPNHVHLILIPTRADGLSVRTIELHPLGAYADHSTE